MYSEHELLPDAVSGMGPIRILSDEEDHENEFTEKEYRPDLFDSAGDDFISPFGYGQVQTSLNLFEELQEDQPSEMTQW